MVDCGTVGQMDFCEVEWRRQKTFHGFERKPMLDKSKVSTVTPVVELRPFTRKEWARDSSLAGSYEVPNIGPSESTTDNQKILSQSLSSSLPNTTHQAHIINITDQIMPKVNRIHPRVNPKMCMTQTLQNGFTPTLGERTRTTLAAMHNEKCSTKRHGYLDDVNFENADNLQGVYLSGAKLTKGIAKRRLEYLNPLSKYDKCENRKVLVDLKDNSNLSFSRRQQCSSSNLNMVGQTHSSVFNGSDLSGVLPSVQLSHRSKRFLKQGSVPRLKSGRNKYVCPRIGGIKSSFQIMIENGPPVNIERHLVVELEINLENVRRHRDSRLYSSPKHKSFQQITYRSQPTVGETQLQRGLSMNSQRSQKTVCESVSKTNVCLTSEESKADCGDSGIQSPVGTSEDLEETVEFQEDQTGQLVQSLRTIDNTNDKSNVTDDITYREQKERVLLSSVDPSPSIAS